MKKGKFISSLIILLLAAGAVFVLGWVQFLVKPGECGVMVSKTGGIYPEPIVSGSFLWRWEKLLPTNAHIRVFSLAPYKVKQTISGELPSSALYSMQVASHPDFSYRVEVSLQLTASPERILKAVKDEDIKNQTELNSWYEVKSKIAAQSILDYIFEHRKESLLDPKTISSQDLIQIAKGNSDLEGIEILSAELVSSRLPDTDLYTLAKESYASYQASLNQNLEEKTKELASQILEEERSLKQLEKFGELLQKYPQLEELSKSGDFTQIIGALKTLR